MKNFIKEINERVNETIRLREECAKQKELHNKEVYNHFINIAYGMGISTNKLKDIINKNNDVDNDIIGIKFDLRVGIDNKNKNIDYRKIIEDFENIVSDYFDNKVENTVFLGGKSDFIRENNNLGIKRVD